MRPGGRYSLSSQRLILKKSVPLLFAFGSIKRIHSSAGNFQMVAIVGKGLNVITMRTQTIEGASADFQISSQTVGTDRAVRTLLHVEGGVLSVTARSALTNIDAHIGHIEDTVLNFNSAGTQSNDTVESIIKLDARNL